MVERTTPKMPIELAWDEYVASMEGRLHGQTDAFKFAWKAAKKEWVGLTGEEAMDVTRKEGHELLDYIYEYGTGVEGVEERIVAICKAIEAKLKEKNNA